MIKTATSSRVFIQIFVCVALLAAALGLGLQSQFAARAQTTNLALNKPATASSVFGAQTAALAFDANPGTRWESVHGVDPQWIQVDLGASYNVTSVKLVWEPAYATAFQIQVSANGTTWTNVYSTTTGTGGTQTLTLSGTGRYVRMNGTARALQYGYSLWEFEVYGTPATGATSTFTRTLTLGQTATRTNTQTGPTSTFTRTVTPSTGCGTTNIAQGKTATASSVTGAATAAMAVDANTGTRWESAQGVDPQWIYIDLGSAQSICRVRLIWEGAFASTYQIQTSNDATNWTPIYSTTTSDGATDDLTGLSGSGRYVRMYGTVRATQWGYSLWEMEIYAGSGPTATTGPTVTTGPSLTPSRTATLGPTSTRTNTQPAGSLNLAAWHQAFSSSDENGGSAAPSAVDGALGTRWSSAVGDPQWIYVDLGATATLTRVVLRWEAAYATAYQIQTSANASSWTTIYSTTTGDGGVDDLTVSGTGRYVRMYGTARATAYGYSLWELEVYGSGGLPFTPPPPTATPAPSVTPKPLLATQWDGQINTLMSQLTLAEKISMMAGDPTGFATNGVPRLGIPPLIMSDGPHGIRGGTLWPALVSAAGSFNPALEQQVGAAMAKEFRALGKNVSLGPMLNLIRDGRWGRSNETYSEDPFLSGKMAAARIRGIQTVGVIADAKHYAANNIENGRGGYPVVISERALRELYTYNFLIAVKEGDPWSVMASYNNVNGTAAAANNHLITKILKNDMGYQGFVVSDWGAAYGNTVGDAWGGLDIEMPSPGAYSYANLSAAISNGSVPQSLVDDKVRRILLAMFKAGMMAPGYNPTAYTADLNSAAHKALALQAARENIVLGKNNGNILPLNKATTQKIAIIGPYATDCRNDGGGSGSLNGPYCINITQGITSKIAGSATTIVSDWNAADTVFVVVGINDLGEGFDRTNVDLPVVNGVDQNALVAQVMAAKPNRTVVVYTGGSAAIAGSWSNAPAILFALYPGQEQGNALADVIFGDYNPGGRLSISFPQTADQLPAWGQAYNIYESAGEGRGYYYYDKHNLTPLFAFGHGLSYSSFVYSNLRITGMTVQVDVRNAGTRAGDEVVQLYISDPVASVDRRVKDLRGFQRVNIAAGATTTVTFTLTDMDLSYWNDNTQSWYAEPGTFNVLVGSSSRDIRLQGSFTK